MELTLCVNERINFDESLLNEEDNFNRKGWSERFKAACAFDDEMRVMKVVSRYLTAELTVKQPTKSLKSVNTVKKEFDVLRIFLKYLRNVAEFEDTSDEYALLHTTRNHLKRYFMHLKDEKQLESTTIRNYDALLKSFYDYLGLHNLIEDNPYLDGYLSGSAKTANVIAVSLDEVAILMSCTNLERERLILQFLYDSGLRSSELPRVTLADLSQATSRRTYDAVKEDGDVFMHDDYVALKVQGSKSRVQDEYKVRHTRISYPTLNRIKKYHASPLYKKNIRKYASPDSTPVFLNADGEAYTAGAISELLTKLSERAREKGLLTKSISPHPFRHGFAYSVLASSDAGTSYLDRLVQVQLMLGHENISTTQQTYTKVPIEIYKYLVNEDGEELTRALLMERLWKKTKLRIGLRDTK